MPLYTIIAKREVWAEIEVEANDEFEAEQKVQMWEGIDGNEEEYYYDWFPWEFESIDEQEEEEAE
jgi:hypothetical protein